MKTPSSAKNNESDSNLEQEAYHKATTSTLASIREAVSAEKLTYFSNRSLAEVEALQEEVAAVIPAGNIVGLVLSGLVRLRSRSLPVEQARSDVSALLRGVEMLPRNILPRTLYGTFFAGPAAVLAAYQKLLTLSGKDPDSAFPEGLWQFYLEFALREDSARHANETLGFQDALVQYDLDLSPLDQLAAWVCAVSQIYFQYDELLHNEWRELVYLNLLEEAVAEVSMGHKLQFQRLTQAWAAQRPYQRGQDARHDEDYPHYRRRRFDEFFQSRLAFLPETYRNKVHERYNSRFEKELPVYQQQMTILATLEPERYRENRIRLPIWQARIGIIFQDVYYLLPACHTDHAGRPLLFETHKAGSSFQTLTPDSDGNLRDPAGRLLQADRTGRVFEADSNHTRGYLHPAHFQAVRRQLAAIFDYHDSAGAGDMLAAELDDQLIAVGRSEQERARKALSDEELLELNALKCAPVIINWDQQDGSRPLAEIRKGKRGVGDHSLTIFRSEKSMVFDQSHIFFDGTWGLALSEILTGEAISWAVYFNSLTTPEPVNKVPYRLQLAVQPALTTFPKAVAQEVSAESHGVDTKSLYELRALLPKRHPELKLTVNDLLILYRCEFGHEYGPSEKVEDALFELRAERTPEAQETYKLVNTILVKSQTSNPSILIPMNVTNTNPRERLYPSTFRNPFDGLWASYQSASVALTRYQNNPTQKEWADFTKKRRSFLVQLNYFGQLLRAYKKVALAGGSVSTATLKLFAHLPDSVLKSLDEIPRRINVLNEVIKGEEVFSNVGRVARGSSLTRFISAKDDNENKALVWGVLTDDNDVLHLSLRDFRPHVTALHKLNKIDLAKLLVTDYLDSFTASFNQFNTRLIDILNANATHVPEEVTE